MRNRGLETVDFKFPVWFIAYRHGGEVPRHLAETDRETMYASCPVKDGRCVYLFTSQSGAEGMAAHLQIERPLCVPMNDTADMTGLLGMFSRLGYTHVAFDMHKDAIEIRPVPIGDAINDIRATPGTN